MIANASPKINFYQEELNVNRAVQHANLEDADEALYLCDITTVERKFYLWQKFLPDIKPHYVRLVNFGGKSPSTPPMQSLIMSSIFKAVKCNDDPLVIEALVNLGAGFDCASKKEMQMVLDKGVAPDRIMFAHPCKPVTHINYAKLNNISTCTMDNEFEIYKLKKHYQNSSLVLRYRSDAKFSGLQLGKKFGCGAKTDAAALLLLAKSLSLQVKGTSFHVGCECREVEAYERAIASAKDIHDFGKVLGYDMNLLDIGGGFPGSDDEHFKQIADNIRSAVVEHFSDETIEVIAEPGRFLVEAAFILVCKIQAKREVRDDAGKLARIMYYINDGIYGSFADAFLGNYWNKQPLYFLENEVQLQTFKSTIWGPTCDSMDMVSDKLYLPNLNAGDLIGFPNMGAYTLVLVSQFNGIPLPRTIYFQQKS